MAGKVARFHVILRLQATEGENAGAWSVRWDVSREAEQGVIEWLAPNDVAFLAHHALVTAFEYSGERRYLAGAQAAADWLISRGLLEDGQLLHGYQRSSGNWSRDSLYVDSGFAAELLASLFRLTGDERYLEALSPAYSRPGCRIAS